MISVEGYVGRVFDIGDRVYYTDPTGIEVPVIVVGHGIVHMNGAKMAYLVQLDDINCLFYSAQHLHKSVQASTIAVPPEQLRER